MDKTWRLLTDPPQSAAINMASDEAIAISFSEGKSPASLRLYSWDRPSFSVGAFQTLDADWIAALDLFGLPVIRRITGGRGLLHEHELTYSVISSTSDPHFCGGIKGTFQAIATGLLEGLRQLSVEATLHIPVRSLQREGKNPLCFDTAGWYEITAQGKKLIGSAQRRWKSHFLQHGALILKKSKDTPDGTRPFPGWLSSENQISLSELMSPLCPHASLVQALIQGFENTLSIELKPGALSAYEQEIMNRLLLEKYGRREWNLYRSTAKKQ